MGGEGRRKKNTKQMVRRQRGGNSKGATLCSLHVFFEAVREGAALTPEAPAPREQERECVYERERGKKRQTAHFRWKRGFHEAQD